jgi:tetratricopeptide (TPR) repeat protein
LRLKNNSEPALVLQLYERALQQVTQPADYRNTLVTLAEAQQLLEAGCQVYRKAQAFEQARQVAQFYGKLVPSRLAQALLGEIAEDWAKAQREQLRRLDAAEVVRREPVEVWPRYREAGAAYAATAAAYEGRPEQPQWWKRAADCYFEGADFTTVISVLQRLVNLPASGELLGEAWFRLAQAHRALQQESAAELALQRCIAFPGPFAYRARYQLALLDLEHGRLDEAEATLRQNLDLMVQAPDREAQEQSLYALAKLLFQRDSVIQAEARLEQALRLNPDHPEALAARFRLGECYRRRALQAQPGMEDRTLTPVTRESHYMRYRGTLQDALDQYGQVVTALRARQAVRPLGEADTILLRQSLFAAADCRENRREYEQASGLYQHLLEGNPPLAERLQVLRRLGLCYHFDKKEEQSKQAFLQLGTLVDSAEEADFQGPPGTWTRQRWQQWLKVIRGQ